MGHRSVGAGDPPPLGPGRSARPSVSSQVLPDCGRFSSGLSSVLETTNLRRRTLTPQSTIKIHKSQEKNFQGEGLGVQGELRKLREANTLISNTNRRTVTSCSRPNSGSVRHGLLSRRVQNFGGGDFDESGRFRVEATNRTWPPSQPVWRSGAKGKSGVCPPPIKL